MTGETSQTNSDAKSSVGCLRECAVADKCEAGRRSTDLWNASLAAVAFAFAAAIHDPAEWLFWLNVVAGLWSLAASMEWKNSR